MGQIKGPAQKLADYMIKMSFQHHNAEWAMGLEYELWHEISGNRETLSPSEVNELQELADWCEGWITMKYTPSGDSLEFQLLEDWKLNFKKNSPF